MHTYRVAGLSVESQAPLPGLNAVAPGDCRPDVIIRYGQVPATLANADRTGPTWQMAEDRFLLTVPGIARFLLTGGARIDVETNTGVPPEDVAIFLVGTMFGILLHQRERVVLHASAVRVGDQAVLFCGPSGAGKSTTAAALSKRGYTVICDDFCALQFPDGKRPCALPDGRSLKLWADAIGRLGFHPGNPIRGQLKKYYVEPPAALDQAVAVGAIYELAGTRPVREAGIVAPNLVDAALIIRRNAYRPLLVQRMGQRALYFEAASRLAGAAGIYTLSRPLDFAQMDTVIAKLEEHWATQGLLRKAA